MTVGDVCTRPVITAHPDETIAEAAKRMRDRHVGDLVVTDSQHRPIGMLTDRDIVVSAVAQSWDKIDRLLVGDVMTREPITALAHEGLSEVISRMRARGIRRLPVVTRDGRVDGIIAFDDVLEVLSAELGDLARLVARERQHERDVRSTAAAAPDH